MTELKNLARRDFKNAKKQGLSADSIQPLAKKFFQLIREHSRLKKASSAVKYCDQSRRARHACHFHFWQFARKLLDDNSTNSITPHFTQEKAHGFFQEVYHAEPRNFVQPAWMPIPNKPQSEFDSEEIHEDELFTAIKRSKSSSTPSPFDQVSYLVFKRCPSLRITLLDLFNACWSQSVIPTQWKMAAIKLIP